MDGEGISWAVIFAILFFAHIFVCGLASLLALLIGEISSKRRLPYLPLFIGPFTGGLLAFVLVRVIWGDDEWFYLVYGIFVSAGLLSGLVYAFRKSKRVTDELAD